MKKVKIQLEIELDDNNVPENITWKSDDPPSNGQEANAKAFFLSIFDEQQLDTLKIDIWNKKLEIGEMQRLCYYTLRGMADSFFRATNDEPMANDMARFAQYFGEKQGIIKPDQNAPSEEN